VSHSQGNEYSKKDAICAVVALALALAGCAPLSANGLRTDPGRSGTFSIALPYDQVYQNEQRGFLACMTGGYYKMTFAIRPRISAAKRTASVVLMHHGGWTDVWAVVDIVSAGSGSNVSAYTTNHPLMKDFISVARDWAAGDQRCQRASITTQQFPLSE